MPRKSVATYHDARLVLDLYELRREERLRAARDWFVQRFSPKTLDDVRGLPAGSPENASYRMVTTYWDMAASLIVHGVLDSDLFLESGGEMLVVWTKLEPLVPAIRKELNARLLLNVEKVVQASPHAQERVAGMRARFGPRP
ncbi:MAG: hypothetical protein ABI592_12550 [Acidobacteriota bacterium]